MTEHSPDLFTPLQAADYLLISVGSPNEKATIKRLDRFQKKYDLKQILIMRKRRFARAELDRVIQAQAVLNNS